MKILLTGAGGFVGGHLLQQAIQQFGRENVVALSSRQLADSQCIVIPDHDLSVLDRNVFNDIDVLIHAGAFTPKNGREANDFRRCGSNISFVESLLDFEFSVLKKVIFTSTLDVYSGADVISEVTPVGPSTLYGASKLYGEKMVEVFARERSIEHVILRLGHIYGPGEEAYQKMLPLTIANVVAGKSVQIFGSGEELRSFIFIDDVVSSILNAVLTALPSSIVNVVGGNSISIRSLVEKIIKLSDKAVDILHQEASTVGRDFVFDNRLLKATLLKSEFDFDRGLALEIEHMKRKFAAHDAG